MSRRERLERATRSWSEATAASARAFASAAAAPEATQEKKLATVLSANASSAAGRRYGFAAIRSVAEYQRRVPIVAYDEIASDLTAGATTSDHILMYETTSGSSAAAKRIPYTAALRSEFMAALEPWMHDIYANRPHLHGGSAYWSISPVVAGRGFEDDRDYFDGPSRRALEEILTVPASLSRIVDVEASRFATLLALLADRELSFISVWNPSFLTVLMRDLFSRFDELVARMPEERRAAELRATGPEPAAIWPRLALISCWTDAAAALALPQIERLFPGVEIQPKGLIATEGIVSIPVGHGRGSSIAVTSHFFEFRERESGKIFLAHDLREGCEYEVILTTSGGLYRYALGDIVRVTGRYVTTPRIEFVGRAGDVADIAGEKLAEPFVRSVLMSFAPAADLLFISPRWEGDQARYLMFVESELGKPELADVARRVDDALRSNPHYDFCRSSGQLGSLQAVSLRRGANDVYLRIRAASCRIGDVKPRAIEKDLDWMERFRAAEAVA